MFIVTVDNDLPFSKAPKKLASLSLPPSLSPFLINFNSIYLRKASYTFPPIFTRGRDSMVPHMSAPARSPWFSLFLCSSYFSLLHETQPACGFCLACVWCVCVFILLVAPAPAALDTFITCQAFSTLSPSVPSMSVCWVPLFTAIGRR